MMMWWNIKWRPVKSTFFSSFFFPFSLSLYIKKKLKCNNIGSGFRCIRLNAEIHDPCIAKAAGNSHISHTIIRDLLPQEITLWIDPCIVSYRIGENGSISTLYDSNRSSPSNSLDSTESDERCEISQISPEINKLVLDLYEKSHNSIITKPKRYSRGIRQANNSPPKYYQSFYNHSPSNNQYYYQNKAF